MVKWVVFFYKKETVYVFIYFLKLKHLQFVCNHVESLIIFFVILCINYK